MDISDKQQKLKPCQGLKLDDRPAFVPDGVIETSPGIFAMRMRPNPKPVKLG